MEQWTPTPAALALLKKLEDRKEAEKERKAMKRYLYDCDYSPERFIELRASLEGEDYSIYVTYDEELLRVLQSLIKQS